MRQFLVLYLLLVSLMTLGTMPAQALTLSPANIVLETSPGEVRSFRIKVFNEGKAAVRVAPSLSDFVVNAQKGSKVFRPAGSTPHSLAKYIKYNPEPFVLEPRESKEVTFSLETPKDVSGGSHSLVFFEAVAAQVPQNKSTRVQFGVRLGVAVYQEVKDTTVIKSRVDDIQVTQNGEETEFVLTVINQGNTYIKATGLIAIMDPKEEQFFGTVDLSKEYILRGQAGLIRGKLDKKLAPGTYRLLITYQYRGKNIPIYKVIQIPG